MDLTLETETEIGELDAKLAGQQHSVTGFARQMWAYITVNQLISERWGTGAWVEGEGSGEGERGYVWCYEGVDSGNNLNKARPHTTI